MSDTAEIELAREDSQWSSDGMARRDALAQWRAWAASTIAPIEVAVFDADSFAARWVSHGIGQLRLLHLHAPAQRVTHTGAYTDFGEYELLAFVRPGQDAAVAPASVAANAENIDDLSDEVTVSFLAASAYDSVAVYRDGTRLATLPGSATQYVDHVARGLYQWEVSGIVDGVESGRAGANSS